MEVSIHKSLVLHDFADCDEEGESVEGSNDQGLAKLCAKAEWGKVAMQDRNTYPYCSPSSQEPDQTSRLHVDCSHRNIRWLERLHD